MCASDDPSSAAASRPQPAFPSHLQQAGEIKAVLDVAGIDAAEAELREDLGRYRRGLEKFAALGRVPGFDIDARLAPLAATLSR